jgi:hypothetical protein
LTTYNINAALNAESPTRTLPACEVLDDVAAFTAQFSSFPTEHCAPALALWYAHTHIADRLHVTPRLILSSAEPGSGKTRVLEVAQYLVAAPEMTISATTAALLRLVAQGPITILFDEVDTIFRAGSSGHGEALRGLLNAGYKRTATVARVGNGCVQRLPAYAPAALAGIAGNMPATITSRAITIHMRRRKVNESVQPFRERAVVKQARPIRDALATWVCSVVDQISRAEPEMPEGVVDRSAEIWEPLLAIADAAGGHWPETARRCCTHFVVEAGPQITSLGVQLLADICGIYAARSVDRMASTELLAVLTELDESPWANLHGRPLDARRLAKEVSRYGVGPVTFDINGDKAKGYVTYETTGKQAQVGLTDAWSRYLPAPTGNARNLASSTDQPVTASPVTTGRTAIP